MEVRPERKERHDERRQAGPTNPGAAPAQDHPRGEQHRQRHADVGVVLGDVAGEVDEVRRRYERQ